MKTENRWNLIIDKRVNDVLRNKKESIGMKQPFITQIRTCSGFMRSIAMLVLVTFSTVMYSPAIYAAYHGIEQQLKYQQEYPVFGELSATVEQLYHRLAVINAYASKNATDNLDVHAYDSYQSHIADYLADLKSHHKKALDYFQDQQQTLKETNAGARASDRLAANEQQYRKQMEALRQHLQRLLKSDTAKTFSQHAQQTYTLVKTLRPNRISHSYDQDMPFGPLQANAAEPLTTDTQIQQLLGPAASSQPTPADLMETLDVQLTPAIQQKAGELANDPVQIYNWVYNHIAYVPSHGSIQGSEHTYHTGKGNAIDTASLTIALLRSANIPARYQYGTVWLPIDQVMNWVGGVKVPESAQVLLSQGGVPDTLVKINGEFRFMELEHAWVEYWDGSQWQAVDPSYKQYRFTDGVSLADQVPFDAQTFADTLQQNAMVNEAEGWVQHIDQGEIQIEMDSYRQALEDFLTNQHPNASVVEILGDQQIIQRSDTNPPAQLPYAQIRAHQAISEIPDNLRHKFKFELQSEFGSRLFNHTVSTPEIAGRQLAFAFSPATEADEQALLNYLPDNPQTPEDLPDTIPANLFNVVGEFSIDGQVVANSSSLAFGQELKTEKGLWSPKNGWELTSNPVITGEYQAIGLDLHGVAPRQLESLKANLENTQTRLNNNDFNALTKHDLVGDLLQSGVISYLAITHVQNQLTALSSDIVYYREPSYGTFSTNARINYFFGVPQSVAMTGVLMDMDRMKSSAECKLNCWNNWVDFNRNTGAAMSAYEHLVPEQIFSTEADPVEGVSAVKAISIASQQGQRIYTITQDNLTTALSQLSVEQAIKDEIQTSVQSGMEATVSQSPITYAGWTGVGYTITDPETGAGAYKISGGANGGDISTAIGILLGFAGLVTSVGEKLEALIGLGGLYARIGRFLGPLATVLSVIDAKLAGCDRGASLGIFAFSLAGWIGILTLNIFAIPFLILIAGIIAISIAQFLVTNAIKEDFC